MLNTMVLTGSISNDSEMSRMCYGIGALPGVRKDPSIPILIVDMLIMGEPL